MKERHKKDKHEGKGNSVYRRYLEVLDIAESWLPV